MTQDITLTRPVTEADWEWIAALLGPSHIEISRGQRAARGLAPGFTPPAPTVRPIPCHPTRPII